MSDSCNFKEVNETFQCLYVRSNENCKSYDGIYLDYLGFVVCGFYDNSVKFGVALFLLVLWLAVLFTIMATAAERFFCPSLKVISVLLKLSDNVAGVTFLAFGNGSPDAFTQLAAINNESESSQLLAVSALFGAALFVTTIVAGSIAVTVDEPFKLPRRPFLRDTIFYLGVITWLFFILRNQPVNILEIVIFVSIYFVYIIVVIISRKIHEYLQARSNRHSSGDNIELDARSRVSTEDNLSMDENLRLKNDFGVNDYCSTSRNDEDEDYWGWTGLQQAHKSSAHFVNDVSQETDVLLENDGGRNDRDRFLSPSITNTWKILFKGAFCPPQASMRTGDQTCIVSCQTCAKIVKWPLHVIIGLTIPIVDYDEPLNNWNRPLNSLNIITGPVFFMFATNTAFVTIYKQFNLVELMAVLGFVVALVVFFTSKNDTAPFYHGAFFSSLAFFVSIGWIYVTAEEIIPVLLTFGLLGGISESILGLTVLAMGNSVSDWISNLSVSKQGQPVMAFSACFGAQIFNVLIGFGVSCLIATFRNGGILELSQTGLDFVFYLATAATILFSIVYMLCTCFKVTKMFGVCLIIFYIIFLTVVILLVVNVI